MAKLSELGPNLGSSWLSLSGCWDYIHVPPQPTLNENLNLKNLSLFEFVPRFNIFKTVSSRYEQSMLTFYVSL